MENLKILICDDNEKKTDDMVNYLNRKYKYGIDIDVGENIENCIDLIDRNLYNLFFIDLNMEDTLHGTFRDDAGFQIIEYIKKHYSHEYEIIILTNRTKLKEKFKDEIEKYYFIDYTYTPTKNDILENELTKALEEKSRLLRINMDNKEYDIAIITALQEEMDQVRLAFDVYQEQSADKLGREKYSWENVDLANDVHSYKATKIENSEGKSVSIISSSSKKMGLSNTGVLATKMILNFKPKILVMLGICAGNKDEGITYGDIIVVDKSFDYQAGKTIVDESGKNLFKPDYDVLSLNPTYFDRFSEYKEKWTYHIAKNWREKKDEKFADPNVYIGVFGSGSAVMANDTIFAEIGDHSRKIIGIDMEAYALFVAAERTISNNKPKALVIKGVQDYADSVKGGKTPEQKAEAKKYTKYGSFASAMFFINACDEFLISDINQ